MQTHTSTERSFCAKLWFLPWTVLQLFRFTFLALIEALRDSIKRKEAGSNSSSTDDWYTRGLGETHSFETIDKETVLSLIKTFSDKDDSEEISEDDILTEKQLHGTILRVMNDWQVSLHGDDGMSVKQFLEQPHIR